jgi:cell fate (sporulation/competence/biofilm development) regulator YlbF (YheA/YmcA/DUF963 family)
MKENKKTMQGTSKQIQQLANIMNALPQPLVQIQLKKQWRKMTKCLNKPQKNIDKITKLQNTMTKKIKYKNKYTYDWLQEIKENKHTNKHNEFIKWFKEEYATISLKKQGIIK